MIGFGQWRAVVVVGVAVWLLGGGSSIAYPSAVSPYSLPQKDRYNRTPDCPVSAQTPYCVWNQEPPYDPGNPESYGPDDYWENCAYWTAEKRPDIEQLAVQRYGYPPSPGGAADWKPDAVKAGYPVNHRPRVGDVAVWVPPLGRHVAYVEKVKPSGAIIVSEMDFGTTAGKGAGATEWIPPGTARQLWFIHLKRSPGS